MEEDKRKCCFCEKKFSNKQNVYRHIRKVHKDKEEDYPKNKNIKCPNTDCSASFFHRKALRSHICTVHGISLDMEVHNFPTFKDFKIWKEAIERHTNSSYFASQAAKILASKEKAYYFHCHRTGFNFSKLKRQRKMKSIGSKKINAHCPSSMDVIVKTNEVKVQFYKTHYGHKEEIRHIFLSKVERSKIAEKIRQGVAFQQILDDVRDSFPSKELKRIHLLTRKDLSNIVRDFHILKKEQPHNNDEELNNPHNNDEELNNPHNNEEEAPSYLTFTSDSIITVPDEALLLQNKIAALSDALCNTTLSHEECCEINNLLDECLSICNGNNDQSTFFTLNANNEPSNYNTTDMI